MKLPVIDLKGKAKGDVDAPDSLFAAEVNECAVQLVCQGQRFRFYKKTATVKGRAEVSGGGRKIRKQKGGGAGRQGGNRAPHWSGGGVVFGPKAIKRDYKINKKVYQKALSSILSDRHQGGQIRVLDASDLSCPKTQTVAELLKVLSLNGARVGFVLDRVNDESTLKSARNIKNVDVLPQEKWTTLDFVKTDSLIITKSALDMLVKRYDTSAVA